MPCFIREEQEAEIPLPHLKWLLKSSDCLLFDAVTCFHHVLSTEMAPWTYQERVPYCFEISLTLAYSCGDALFSVEQDFVHQLLVQTNCAYIAR